MELIYCSLRTQRYVGVDIAMETRLSVAKLRLGESTFLHRPYRFPRQVGKPTGTIWVSLVVRLTQMGKWEMGNLRYYYNATEWSLAYDIYT